jgi:tripartite-type tricarboxylate transporter receptor subunit TctC
MKLSNALLCASLLVPTLSSGAYPDRPIKVIVPYTPGSGPDVVARTLGTSISPRIGQPFVVENKPGANGTIGIDALARSPADGYTIGVVVNSFSMNPSLYKNTADSAWWPAAAWSS